MHFSSVAAYGFDFPDGVDESQPSYWACLRPMTADGPPILGTARHRNLYLNTGWNYGGFKATPASGWTFAHTIANDAEHELNRCYSLDRFEKGRELDDYGIGNWTFYLAFSFFRLAAICQGVYKRALDGNASNPEKAKTYHEIVKLLARMAVELIDAATVNKTDFFREPRHFELMSQQMLPSLLGLVLVAYAWLVLMVGRGVLPHAAAAAALRSMARPAGTFAAASGGRCAPSANVVFTAAAPVAWGAIGIPIVVGGRIVGAMRRRSQSWITNVRQGAKPVAVTPSAELVALTDDLRSALVWRPSFLIQTVNSRCCLTATACRADLRRC